MSNRSYERGKFRVNYHVLSFQRHTWLSLEGALLNFSLLEITFKVFNNREEEAKKEKKERKVKYALFTAAIQGKNSIPLAYQPWPTPMGPNPLGPCFRCN